ncbi:MAG: sel1 repeat family protein [Erysipelotrichaceae bacterium]|nr:sel1 repeat family protein [Erysipelotrichaceae bacterium]
MLDDDKAVNEAIEAYQSGDYKAALKKFKNLAFWNNRLAYYFLGQMYLNGNGVKANANKATKYFRDGVKKGSVDCAITMGDAYYAGGTNTPSSYATAFDYYQIGVKQNNAYCIYKTADMLWDGLGVQQNKHLAVDYYEQAALLGQVNAMAEIANCYHYGVEKPVDCDKAQYWYEKASDNGNYSAMYEYAKWLNDEFHDVDKAIVYYEKAIGIAKVDYYALTQACVNLGDLYKNQRNDLDAARRMYERGIEIFDIVRSTHNVFKTADYQAAQKAQNELQNM